LVVSEVPMQGLGFGISIIGGEEEEQEYVSLD